MKKDKEWAKEQLEYYIKAAGNPFNGHTPVMINAYKNVEHIINQLDEPEKVVIPRFVAEQLEYWKRNKMNILWQFFLREIPSSTLSWLESDAGNYDKLIDAEKNGYVIEKEKLYYVKLPNTNSESEYLYLAQGNSTGDCWFNSRLERLDYESGVCKHQFTEKEIKSINEHYWQFAQPVEETP